MTRLTSPRTLSICTLFALTFTAAAFAQAPPASTPTPPPGWSGEASLSFVDAAGNSSARTLGLEGQVIYHPTVWTVTEHALFAHSTTDGVLSAESLTNELTAERQLTERLSAYGRFDYLRNQFAGIDHRIATDGGVGYALLPPGGSQTLNVTAGLGYSREDDLAGFTQSFGTDDAGAAYAWTLSKTAKITDEAKYTGSLADAGNWRLRNTAAVTAALNARFALKLSHRLDFVNEPVPGFGRTDQLTSASLVVSF
jgi:putative salt-induced outer membrane protein YdiY